MNIEEEEKFYDIQYEKMKKWIERASEKELEEHYDWYEVEKGDREDLLNTMFESYCGCYDKEELEERCNVFLIEEKTTKNELFNIIDNLLQDCYNETIDREDYDLEEDLMKTLSINNEEIVKKIIEIIYKNVELYTLKLKDSIEDIDF